MARTETNGSTDRGSGRVAARDRAIINQILNDGGSISSLSQTAAAQARIRNFVPIRRGLLPRRLQIQAPDGVRRPSARVSRRLVLYAAGCGLHPPARRAARDGRAAVRGALRYPRQRRLRRPGDPAPRRRRAHSRSMRLDTDARRGGDQGDDAPRLRHAGTSNGRFSPWCAAGLNPNKDSGGV